MKKLLYAVIFLVIFVFGLTFAVRNPETVRISYYFGIDLELPLTLLLLGSLAAGLLIGYLTALTTGVRRNRRRNQKPHTVSPTTSGSMLATRRN